MKIIRVILHSLVLVIADLAGITGGALSVARQYTCPFRSRDFAKVESGWWQPTRPFTGRRPGNQGATDRPPSVG